MKKNNIRSVPIAKSWICFSAFAFLIVVFSSAGLGAVKNNGLDKHKPHNFDRRIKINAGYQEKPSAEQINAQNELRRKYPQLKVRFNKFTGGARTVINPSGFLTEPSASAVPPDPVDSALSFVETHRTLFRLKKDDLKEHRVSNEVHSKITGATHVYLQQNYRNIPVANGLLNIGVDRNGRIMSVNNEFVPDLKESVNTTRPTISAQTAIMFAALNLGIDAPGTVSVRPDNNSRNRRVRAIYPFLTQQETTAELKWLPIRHGDTRLVWHVVTEGPDDTGLFELNIDAETGMVWTRFNLTNQAQYLIYEQPAESPNHVDSPLPFPPDDGRNLVIDPEDSAASPEGWFDNSSGVMKGNNVHACINADFFNTCDTPEHTCDPLDPSSFDCSFSLDLTADPAASQAAAVTNLFYWNNLVHDIHYMYGFDEQAGNFQENNFGSGGAGSDSVTAHGQDGSNNCNARFTTPSDGSNPKMEVFTCNNTSPERDGSFDNGVIVHEYGHGITNRLVGGPANVSCLQNNQQPGEGWSDFFALVYTAKPGDQGTDGRGIGTYLFGQAANDTGIRTQPYSTDQSINTFTYESISGLSVPHGVGSVWAQALWEVYWALVDKHGFDPDLSNPEGRWAGNQRALFYVTEGLKHTACSPTFIDARDGIINAVVDAQTQLGSDDFCTVWQAFADFGLGVDATTPSNSATTATNGFDVPVECQCSPRAIADAGPDQNICLGQSMTIGTPAQPDNSYSWSPGGQTTAQITVFPAATETYTVTATTTCGTADDQVTVFVDDGSALAGFDENFENDISTWTATGLWHRVTNASCISPGSSSGSNSFAYTQDSSCSYNTGGANSGTLTSPAITGINSNSTLTFHYYRQVESYASGSYDRTEVEIVTENDATVVWSKDSGDTSADTWTVSETIDLSDYTGQTIQVRFRFNTVDGTANNFDGWFIDDIVVTGESPCSGAGTPEPSIVINAPADNSEFTEGDTITFTGTATDAEDGDLSAQIDWSYTTNGSAPTVIDTGASVRSVLPVGTHTVTATVTDTDNNSTSASITVTVSANTAPTVSITAPTEGSTFTEGDSITFNGTATDTEDGDLSTDIDWSYTTNGSAPTVIDTGASIASALPPGTHTVTAAVTDAHGASDSASITVTVNANTDPTVSIDAPTDNATFTDGQSIAFNSTASDSEDGDLSAQIEWSYTTGGSASTSLGFGASVTSALPEGAHTITATVTDTHGASDSASITVIVNANADPNVSISSPTDGSTFTEDDSITFNGTASDSEDGDLSSQIEWSYTTDDSTSTSIGTGASVTSGLPVGTHIVTATVTDSGEKSATDSISVTVNANPTQTCNYPAWICRLLNR